MRALRDALRAAGLTGAAVADVERVVSRQLDAVRAPAVRRVLRARGDDAGALLALFVYDDRVDGARVRDAVGASAFDTVVECGLVHDDDGWLRANGRLVPFLGTYIAADRPHAGSDAAMPPGPTTQEVGRALPRTFSGTVLDIATGPGSLAIVAAMRGARVVGTDVSERALAFARFNAAINDVHVDWREGSLLEPVASERFDFVCAQPPYIPHPDALPGVTFAHGGAAGDELVFELFGGLAEALAPEGHAIVRFDAPRRDVTLVDRVRAAIGDEVDVAVLNWAGPSAEHEAVIFASLADGSLGAAYVQAVREYGDHLAALGITEFVQAIAVVRATDGPVWTAGLPVPGAPAGWEAIAAYLDALTLTGAADNVLAHTRLQPNPAVVVELERTLGAGDEELALDVRPGGIAARRSVDGDTLSVLESFAGGYTPASVATAVAEVSDLAPSTARTMVLGMVREALAAGHLLASEA